MWSEQEQGHSPTFRDLKAIHNVIESCAPLLAHRKVKLFSDSHGACTIVDKGGPKLILNQVAIDFFCVGFTQYHFMPSVDPKVGERTCGFYH